MPINAGMVDMQPHDVALFHLRCNIPLEAGNMLFRSAGKLKAASNPKIHTPVIEANYFPALPELCQSPSLLLCTHCMRSIMINHCMVSPGSKIRGISHRSRIDPTGTMVLTESGMAGYIHLY